MKSSHKIEANSQWPLPPVNTVSNGANKNVTRHTNATPSLFRPSPLYVVCLFIGQHLYYDVYLLVHAHSTLFTYIEEMPQ